LAKKFHNSLEKRNKKAKEILSLEKDLIQSRTAELKLHMYQHTIRKISYHKRLFSWIKIIEKRLFSEDIIDNMSASELLNMFEVVSKQIKESFDDVQALDNLMINMDRMRQSIEQAQSDIAIDEEKEKAKTELKTMLMSIVENMPEEPEIVDVEVDPKG